MKILKHLSLVAVSIAVISIILKIQFDIQSYQVVSEVLTETNGDSCPTVLGGGMISTTLYLTLAILSLALSIIGYMKRNQFHKLALWLNILAILYILLPIGIIIGLSS
jgi:glucan phosphoethanolaminetransferase (alkaline phosphatase superfamily)